jgi:hypothetical protein
LCAIDASPASKKPRNQPKATRGRGLGLDSFVLASSFLLFTFVQRDLCVDAITLSCGGYSAMLASAFQQTASISGVRERLPSRHHLSKGGHVCSKLTRHSRWRMHSQFVPRSLIRGPSSEPDTNRSEPGDILAGLGSPVCVLPCESAYRTSSTRFETPILS